MLKQPTNSAFWAIRSEHRKGRDSKAICGAGTVSALANVDATHGGGYLSATCRGERRGDDCPCIVALVVDHHAPTPACGTRRESKGIGGNNCVRKRCGAIALVHDDANCSWRIRRRHRLLAWAEVVSAIHCKRPWDSRVRKWRRNADVHAKSPRVGERLCVVSDER